MQIEERQETDGTKELQKNYCNSQGSQYYAYDIKDFQFNDTEKYELIKKLSKGKFSIVYKGIDNSTSADVILKIVKPMRVTKIAREIKILNILKPCSSVMQLTDLCVDEISGNYALICQYFSETSLKEHLNQFDEYTIKIIIY